MGRKPKESRAASFNECQSDNQHGAMDAESLGGLERHDIKISSEEMKVLQAADPCLRELQKISSKDFFYMEGLLYQSWIPSGRKQEEVEVEQLVLPSYQYVDGTGS